LDRSLIATLARASYSEKAGRFNSLAISFFCRSGRNRNHPFDAADPHGIDQY
jgi:hypothetical protein